MLSSHTRTLTYSFTWLEYTFGKEYGTVLHIVKRVDGGVLCVRQRRHRKRRTRTTFQMCAHVEREFAEYQPVTDNGKKCKGERQTQINTKYTVNTLYYKPSGLDMNHAFSAFKHQQTRSM